jgi:hypothetical protein
MKLKTTFIAVALLLSVTSTQAALVETDWNNTGDGLATLDTDTGIEWLDLTQTDGMSINQAEGLTSSTFSGWRLPTRAEVTQMMVNAFSSEASRVQGSGWWSVTSNASYDEADSFSALFGKTYMDSPNYFTFGLLKNDPGQASGMMLSGIRYRPNDGYIALFSNAETGVDIHYSSPSYGIYLVSDGGTTLSSQLDPSLNANNANAPVADVSAPTIMGGLFALLGLAAIRRRSSDTSEARK